MTKINILFQSNFRWATQFCKQGGSGWKGAQLTICWPKALPVVTSNHHQLVIRSFAPTSPRISLPDTPANEIRPARRGASGEQTKWSPHKKEPRWPLAVPSALTRVAQNYHHFVIWCLCHQVRVILMYAGNQLASKIMLDKKLHNTQAFGGDWRWPWNGCDLKFKWSKNRGAGAAPGRGGGDQIQR